MRLEVKKKGFLILAIIVVIFLMVVRNFTFQKESKHSDSLKKNEKLTEEAGFKDASLFFDRESFSVSLNSDFEIIAKVDPGSNTTQGINAAQVDLKFDPAVLQFVKMEAVAPFSQIGAPIVDNNKGVISSAFFIGADQVTKISDIVRLTFHAKTVKKDSLISVESSSELAIMDGKGTLVLANRRSASVNVNK